MTDASSALTRHYAEELDAIRAQGGDGYHTRIVGRHKPYTLITANILARPLSRMAPQMNIFDLSLSVKNLIFTFLMVLYCGFLIPLMLEQLAEFRGTVEVLKTLSGFGEP